MVSPPVSARDMVIISVVIATLFISALFKLYLHRPKEPRRPTGSSRTTSSKSTNYIKLTLQRKASTDDQDKLPAKVDELKHVFQMLNKNHCGFLSKQEIRKTLDEIGITVDDEEVEDIVRGLDCNGDGFVDFDEFYKLYGPGKVHNQPGGKDAVGTDDEEEEELKVAFDVFDGNRDGLITGEELAKVLSSLGLKEGQRVEDCKRMIKNFDKDGDGMINYHEFKRMMKGY